MVCSPICDTTLILLDRITYQVQVRDVNGCTDEDAVSFDILKDRNVFIPNAFSPNADGVNDKFMIYGGKDVSIVKSFRVFNRWGEILHEKKDFPANDPDYAWDGILNGKNLDANVFIYFAEVVFLDGWVEQYQGCLLYTSPSPRD